MTRVPKRKTCYICGKEIRFITAPETPRGFIICDYESHILKSNSDGDFYILPNGRSFRARKATPEDATVSVGYKLHKCRI